MSDWSSFGLSKEVHSRQAGLDVHDSMFAAGWTGRDEGRRQRGLEASPSCLLLNFHAMSSRHDWLAGVKRGMVREVALSVSLVGSACGRLSALPQLIELNVKPPKYAIEVCYVAGALWPV